MTSDSLLGYGEQEVFSSVDDTLLSRAVVGSRVVVRSSSLDCSVPVVQFSSSSYSMMIGEDLGSIIFPDRR